MFKNIRGISQGCPLSVLLFVLSVEIMALRILNNKNIEEFQVKIDWLNHSIKISQLEDDTTLFFNWKLKNWDIIGSKWNLNFWFFSELIMNKDKTEGLWIGYLKHCKDKVWGIKWTDKPVKTLGIYFRHEKKNVKN